MHTPPEKKDFARFVLCDIHLDFDPGTRPNEFFTLPGRPTKKMDTYSNIGYVLLGMIVDEKSSTYIDHLNTNILSPISINDVAVGKTREADLQSNETKYESEGWGPDATIDPYNPKTARLPYGGDGSRKELMDSGGGLIMSANSLARFISQNNVFLEMLDTGNIVGQKGRTTANRQGMMPGTQAVADSFKGKSNHYDMAVIFNRQDVSKTDPGDHSNDFDRLVRHLEDAIRDVL
jgi:CubicO group peptidase (beta-lactamase class C family)